jgi:hypothetical protein
VTIGMPIAKKKMGGLAHGINPKTNSSTSTIFFIKHTDVPAGKTPTYLRIAVDYRPEKEDPFHVRLLLAVTVYNTPVMSAHQLPTSPLSRSYSIVSSPQKEHDV